MIPQRTLTQAFSLHGIGLRGGRPAVATLRPAAPGTGRVLLVGGHRIPGAFGAILDTHLATTLGNDRARVSLVEHCFAALHAAGVDNVEVDVDGDELPVFDGSSRRWAEAIAEVGITTQDAERRVVRIAAPLRVELGSSWAEIHPGEGLTLDLRIEFPHPAIGRQTWTGAALGERFVSELSWARTFGFLRDAEALKEIAKGVSLDNTVVYDEGTGVLNPGGLRAPDEAVRHKALDTVGDLALLGVEIHGHLVSERPGHAVNLLLVRKIAESVGI